MRAPKVPILSTEFQFGTSEHQHHIHAHPRVVKFMEILMEIVKILINYPKLIIFRKSVQKNTEMEQFK